MKWRSICSVTSKSAITPSLSGRIAEIVPGVRPSIRFASTPTACTSPVRWSIATTDGSERTIPRPRTYTSVFAVPRSTAMSRPPKPPRLSKRPMRSFESSSTEAVNPGKALGKQSHEQRAGQPDDVEIVALDRAHERSPAALDRICACASLPLARCDVGGEVARSQLAEGDTRSLVLDDLPPGSEQAEPGHDDVRLSGQLLQHLLGFGRVGGLAEDHPVQDDLGVDAEHGSVARVGGDAARLPLRVLAHDLRGVGELE